MEPCTCHLSFQGNGKTKASKGTGQGTRPVLIAISVDDIVKICPVLHSAFNFSAVDGPREVGGRSLESPDCPFVLQQGLGQGHRAQSSMEIFVAQVKAED